VILSAISVHADSLSSPTTQTPTSRHPFLAQWGGSGPQKGQLWNPYGIAVDQKEKVYVADYANDRIEVFDSIGSYIINFGEKGKKDLNFHHALGVAADQNNILYVADTLNNRIKKYTCDGLYL